ncbi:MAG: hypothetical protein EOO77_43620 [Oxalobacteraceae bacterium]|nr:MAG: hypothetical protein EOO77_43620 [Oxalobacteraceae bacterium]
MGARGEHGHVPDVLTGRALRVGDEHCTLTRASTDNGASGDGLIGFDAVLVRIAEGVTAQYACSQHALSSYVPVRAASKY